MSFNYVLTYSGFIIYICTLLLLSSIRAKLNGRDARLASENLKIPSQNYSLWQSIHISKDFTRSEALTF